MSVKIDETLDDLIARNVSINEPVQWEIGTLVADYHALGQATDATRKIIEKARDNRFPAPRVQVLPIDEPVPEDADDDLVTVFGQIPTVAEELDQDEAEALFPKLGFDRARRFPPKRHLGPVEVFGTPSAAEIPEIIGGESHVPLLSDLLNKFKKHKEPTYIRLDTAQSYKDFRGTQSPEMAALQEKVAELASLLHAHMADGHGGQPALDNELFSITAHDVAVLQGQIADKRVPLKLPPFADGKYDCWHEDGPQGGTICASLMLPGPDGHIRIATAATPVADHVIEVCNYTAEAGENVTELLGVLPTIACMLGGGHLIPRMAAAAPGLLRREEVRRGDLVFIGKIVPDIKASHAALIALCKRAEAGDQQALREWKILAKCAEKSRRNEVKKPNLAEQFVEKARGLFKS